MTDLSTSVSGLRAQFDAALAAVTSAADLQSVRDRFLGRKDGLGSAVKVPGLDLTLAPRPLPVGSRHPLNAMRERIERIFVRMGYEILDGPEAEDDWHNFEALNMPDDHPARDAQDTLYLE